MLQFLKKLFSKVVEFFQPQTAKHQSRLVSTPSVPAKAPPPPQIVKPARPSVHEQFDQDDDSQTYDEFEDESSQEDFGDSNGSYFSLVGEIEKAIHQKNYQEAIRYSKESLHLIADFVRQQKKEYGSFDIQTIPAIEICGTLMAVFGDLDGIEAIGKTVKGIPALREWRGIDEAHKEDAKIVKDILKVVSLNQGVLQNKIKDFMPGKDGRRIATLISWLEKAAFVKREPEKKTHRLFIAKPSTEKTVEVKEGHSPVSHRDSQKTVSIKEIDVKKIPYIPLPRSPMSWDIIKDKKSKNNSTESFFSIEGGSGWQIGDAVKLSPDKRPDPAFRKIYPTSSGIIMVDDLGKAEEFQGCKASVLRYNLRGELVAKQGLSHGIYRIGVNPLSDGIIMMSKECVLHAYDSALSLLVETPLAEAPEIKNASKRLGIEREELKNHIRSVAISRDNQYYFFTVVDEVWCIDIAGRPKWGARLPLQDGWTKISKPSKGFQSSNEIEEAMKFMGLTYPVTTEDVKKRFRQLLKEWHPDLNPNNPTAAEKTRRLISSAETLTGADIASLSEEEELFYAKTIERSGFSIPGLGTLQMSVNIGGTEKTAADWIYAANFAGLNNSAYIAGYSGRVIALDDNGNALLAYDIGSVPNRIADTGDYLYILTGTRLYVLSGEKLHNIVDVYNEGDLVVGQTGFGLLGKNRLQLFKENGVYIGSINSKNPIRRIYSSPNGAVIETRQHSVTIGGLSIF